MGTKHQPLRASVQLLGWLANTFKIEHIVCKCGTQHFPSFFSVFNYKKEQKQQAWLVHLNSCKI